MEQPSGRIILGHNHVEFYDRIIRVPAKLAVGDWIERVYNRHRCYSPIGMIPP